MPKTPILIALLAVLCLARSASACTCSLEGSSPCGSLKGTPVVFAGLVKSIDEEKAEILRFGKKETIRTGLTAHFVVEEPFKGIDVTEVEVVTGGGGGDCGYPFKAGERYLVYAYKSESDALGASASRTVLAPGGRKPAGAGILSATICSRTRTLAEARDDLDLLRALVAGRAETRLFGSVSRYVRPLGTYEYNINYVGPLEGLTVVAEGAQGKLETKTDKEGRYRFAGVSPGKYKVSIRPPEGYGPLFSFDGPEAEVELAPDDCAAEHDFDAQVDGRISGRVFDAAGAAAPDEVQVSVVTLASAGKGFSSAERRSEYTKRGRYEFEGLPPGRYVLGVNVAEPPQKNTPYPTTYYPGSAELSGATVITLGDGQKLTGYDIHLPPRLETITIGGVVVRPDGKPAAGATINLYDAEEPGRALFGFDAKSDAQGRFSIKAFKGRHYLLHAYLAADYLAGTGAQSEAVPVDGVGQARPVKLVLSRQGIFRPEK